jgi:hypothetical protein
VANRKSQRDSDSLWGGVSLVEIDLQRSGTRVLAVPLNRIPRPYRTTYQVCVTRGWKPRAHEVYRIPLREPLPKTGVPLRPTDPDAPLNLLALIDRRYHHGRYGDINFRVDPPPPRPDGWPSCGLARLKPKDAPENIPVGAFTLRLLNPIRPQAQKSVGAGNLQFQGSPSLFPFELEPGFATGDDKRSRRADAACEQRGQECLREPHSKVKRVGGDRRRTVRIPIRL